MEKNLIENNLSEKSLKSQLGQAGPGVMALTLT